MTLRVDFYEAKDKFGELSNYYVLTKPIVYEGKTYASSEHLYQSLKFLYDGASPETIAYAEVVRLAKTPNISKVLARLSVGGGYTWRVALNPIISKALKDGVKRDPKWEDIKVEQMRKALGLKFSQNLHCRQVLLSTGSALLSEHTVRDSYWGDGGDARKGKNVLGNLLMQVRTIEQEKVFQPEKRIKIE